VQFKNTIQLIYNTRGRHGELVEADRTPIKCIIVGKRKATKQPKDKKPSKRKSFDLQIMVSNKGFGAYADILTDDTIRFELDSRLYEVELVDTVNDFNGKVKYYEVNMNEVTGGD